MFNRSGYYDKDNEVVCFTDRDIGVVSCGHYRIGGMDKFSTWRPSGRPDWQIVICADGDLVMRLDGEDRIPPPGTAVLFRPGDQQFYTVEPGKKAEMFFIHFSGKAVGDVLKKLGLYGKTGVHVFPRECYEGILEKIITELQLRPPFFSQMADSLFLELLCRMAREVRSGSAPRLTDQISRALDHFSFNYSRPACVREYAAGCGMSYSNFCRQFRRQTGQTPTGYVRDLRMAAAKELLGMMDLPVSEIAYQVGYQDPLYFSKLFCRSEGVSPSAYKKEKRTEKK